MKLWLLIGELFRREEEGSSSGNIGGCGSDSTTSQASSRESCLSLSFPLKGERVRFMKLSCRAEEVGVKGSLKKDDVDMDIFKDVVLKKGKEDREYEYGDWLGEGWADIARSGTLIGRYGKSVRRGESDMCRFLGVAGGVSSCSESSTRLLVRPRGGAGNSTPRRFTQSLLTSSSSLVPDGRPSSISIISSESSESTSVFLLPYDKGCRSGAGATGASTSGSVVVDVAS